MRSSLNDLVSAADARRKQAGLDLGFAAVDFETFYRSERSAERSGREACSVDLLGNWAYCRHPDWHAYLVSIFAPIVGVNYAGPLEGAPWSAIAGLLWISHNRNFDRHVYERLVELGVAPAPAWREWHDTADLAVYVNLPRSLSQAIAAAYPLRLDKAARSEMDGRTWSELSEDEQKRMLAYAEEDAVACWLLWADHAESWPEHERLVSLHTGEIEFRGIPVERSAIERDLEVLETAKWQARREIPWCNDEDEDGQPVALGSRKALEQECIRRGVPPPRTTAQKSKEFLEWVDRYGASVPAVMGLNRYRRIDRTVAIYRNLLTRIRPDGRAALGLKYGGAERTLRWSGAGRFNLQNLIKVPLCFDTHCAWVEPNSVTTAANVVDLRARFVASPGRKLIIADLSQIEPRILNWIVGNDDFLGMCSKGMSPYEAHARASMGWTGGNLKKEDPRLYALAKARVLALGYGAGWAKFIEMARGYLGSEEEFVAIFAVDPEPAQVDGFLEYQRWLTRKLGHLGASRTLDEWPQLDERTRNIWVNAWTQVQDFRRSNPRIKALWENLDEHLRRADLGDGKLENELPSGRSLRYFNVSSRGGFQSSPGNVTNPRQNTYGGLLTENMVQAIARDCFVHGILNLEAAGFRVLFHVHDEVVVEAPMDAEPSHVVELLTQMPEWCNGLPVAAEAEVSNHYKK